MRRISIVTASVLLAAAAPSHGLTLDFIGQQTFASGYQYGGTEVGGLSGIDYRPATNDFIAISDDPSQFHPARTYTLTLDLTASSFNGVTFTGTTPLPNISNAPYSFGTIDPESIRMLPGGNFVYTSEGFKNTGVDAFIRVANASGHGSSLTIPAAFQQTGPAGTTGIRQNLAFESITVSPDGTRLTTATENALIQDGPQAAFGVGSPARILTYDLASGTPGAQYVYDVAPITTTGTGFSTTGLVELLDIGGGKYLAVERTFVLGATTPFSNTGNSVKIFEIDVNGATDVSGLAALIGETYTSVTKTLVLDLDTLEIPLDNIEGISWGPTLDDGSRSLILVSDNNFTPGTAAFTQFLAFRVGSAVPEPQSWAMLVAGFGLLGATLRQRRAVRLAVA